MPRYEFICEDCKKEFERTLHFEEIAKSKITCPHCGSEKVRREVATFFTVTSKKS